MVVSVDTVEENRRLAKKKGFTFPLLSDPDLTIIDRFGVRHPNGGITKNDIARPAVFIARSSGEILWRDVTDNWRVRVRPEIILDQTKSFE